jgi:hypothetical protein
VCFYLLYLPQSIEDVSLVCLFQPLLQKDLCAKVIRTNVLILLCMNEIDYIVVSYFLAVDLRLELVVSHQLERTFRYILVYYQVSTHLQHYLSPRSTLVTILPALLLISLFECLLEPRRVDGEDCIISAYSASFNEAFMYFI